MYKIMKYGDEHHFYKFNNCFLIVYNPVDLLAHKVHTFDLKPQNADTNYLKFQCICSSRNNFVQILNLTIMN